MEPIRCTAEHLERLRKAGARDGRTTAGFFTSPARTPACVKVNTEFDGELIGIAMEERGYVAVKEAGPLHLVLYAGGAYFIEEAPKP